ncbi:amidase [uncultured Propionivibrio sp.]|uniref:amidase n=1 Tax=uncultured Propionivibrio sp. TaxID=426737 RepID=UPI0029BFE9D3|nr:amidase [uncultured Propionivibrio sp.]
MTRISTLSQHADALRAGTTTAVEQLDTALARIAAPDGEGARVFTRVYDRAARAAAEASDGLRKVGLARSPIDGLTISIKDLFDVRGETTLAGSVVLADAAPADAHAEIVNRLIAAGAVIVGKTNMTEFAYSGLGLNPHYGTPKNTWDRPTGRIPGGSSSGAAISVSDAMSMAAIGTDTGGSVRIPAALNGLTGFKPTARRVPTTGALPLSTHLDSIGPIAPSVACCATLDAILTGETPHALPSLPLRGLRLALPTTVVLDDLDAQVSASFERAVTRLSAAGAVIDEIAVPAFAQLADINAKGGFTAAEAWAWHRHLIAAHPDRYDPRVASRMRRGEAMSAADFIELLQARTQWIDAAGATFAPYDALILPTVPIVAPPIAELAASDDAYFRANGLMLRNPSVINFLDGCALSIPCQQEGEAPVGLMLAGTALSDRRILAIGQACEAALGIRGAAA